LDSVGALFRASRQILQGRSFKGSLRCSSGAQALLSVQVWRKGWNSVPDSPDWRNPRPAPHMSDVQPRLGLLVPNWLRAWWPAFVWAAFIFLMSTDTFSAAHTSSIIEPILRWLLPSLNADQIDWIHHIIRKCAHFTEYFVFAMLLFRGVRGAAKGWRLTWGLTAWLIAAGYSALDEIHQAFVASRTATPYDSLLDSLGAFFAIFVIWLWFRFRRPRLAHIPEAS
jgi:VanZ family protein